MTRFLIIVYYSLTLSLTGCHHPSKGKYRTSPLEGVQYYHGIIFTSFEENGFLFLDFLSHSENKIFPFSLLLKIDWSSSSDLKNAIKQKCNDYWYYEVKFLGEINSDQKIIFHEVEDLKCLNDKMFKSMLKD